MSTLVNFPALKKSSTYASEPPVFMPQAPGAEASDRIAIRVQIRGWGACQPGQQPATCLWQRHTSESPGFLAGASGHVGRGTWPTCHVPRPRGMYINSLPQVALHKQALTWVGT